MEGTRAHALAQPPDHQHVARLAHLASQPPPGSDPQRQRQPHDAALFLEAYVLRLPRPQVSWVFDQRLLDGLALAAGAPPPRRHHAFVDPTGGDHRLQRTTMGEQRDDQAHGLGRGPQTGERRALGGRQRLVACCAQQPLVLP